MKPPLVPTPHAPVGWGELVDKITILAIKRDRLEDAAALANVRTELAALEAIATDAFEALPGLSALRDELAAVNLTLWDIENALREKEARQTFDDTFIELARAVYQRNDERALIKRAINTLLGSGIVEEKSYQHQGRARGDPTLRPPQ